MATWIQEFINIYFLFSSYLVLYISFISQQCWLSFLKLLFCSSINIGISFKNKPASKLLGDLNTSEAVIIFIFIFLKPNEENVGMYVWFHSLRTYVAPFKPTVIVFAITQALIDLHFFFKLLTAYLLVINNSLWLLCLFN